ncbi:hypothetical protein BD289DRAFT_42310 [Coniella lustricola]|uniref:Uncharacterized protein n=1 Tax=Coniella lustricola TaxID=2025994 RepID=A0A2T3A1V5_9PEZI|nr:hypothetical protein BD289DRAFT_42310 [Coniella lustricola]
MADGCYESVTLCGCSIYSSIYIDSEMTGNKLALTRQACIARWPALVLSSGHGQPQLGQGDDCRVEEKATESRLHSSVDSNPQRQTIDVWISCTRSVFQTEAVEMFKNRDAWEPPGDISYLSFIHVALLFKQSLHLQANVNADGRLGFLSYQKILAPSRIRHTVARSCATDPLYS